MTHLSPAEFVDLADGVLAPARASHVDRCSACRTQAEAIETIARDVRAVDVSEPSPLVWPHVQVRVQQAIDRQPAPRERWASRPLSALATAMAMCVALAVGALYARRTPQASFVASPPRDAPVERTADDVAWNALREVAGDIAFDEAHAAGMTTGLDTAERAVLELTPDERTELERLLKDALEHRGA